MAQGYSFREVLESGDILVIRAGLGPDGVALVAWVGQSDFAVWLTYDGAVWERVRTYHYDADDRRDAQEWAAHRLALLLVEYRA